MNSSWLIVSLVISGALSLAAGMIWVERRLLGLWHLCDSTHPGVGDGGVRA